MTRKMILAAAALAAALLVTSHLRAAPKKGATITVRVLSAKVMDNPKFIGKTVAQVSRGAYLTYQDKKNGWYQVQTADGKTGWIHKSAVLEKKVQLSSKMGQAGSGASQEEIELAGRGFTKDVEEKYRSEHGDLDFSHVDNIEALQMDSETVARFAAAGQVGGGQ